MDGLPEHRRSLQITADHLNMTADHLCLIYLNSEHRRSPQMNGTGWG